MIILLVSLFACTAKDTTGIEPEPEPESDADADTDADVVEQENRLANPGFELGESWWRPSGYVSHGWARTGDVIYGSDATFSAREGTHAEKLWGLYTGSVPNDSEHGLTLVDVTAGDVHTFSLWAFTHPDDAIEGGSEAVVFLRFIDAEGVVLAEHTSEPIDEDTPRGEWVARSVRAAAPDGAVGGAVGVRFALADWSSTGSVYLDDVAWTSTGTGAVEGERLLAWSDEFSGTAIDDTKWSHELIAAYTYNNERQEYTDSPDNSRVEDGQLVITARPSGSGYTSARLNTAGKAGWGHGRFGGMVLVPDGVGTWPALWMLPSDWAYGGWPDSGEIDIMEHVGCDVGTMHATVHTGAYNHLQGTQQGGSITADAWSGRLYAVDWSEERMVFSLDGTEYFRFDNDGVGDPRTWPFDQVFHFVVNLAVGGDWGGYCGIDSGAFPEEYRIDWIRVYQ